LPDALLTREVLETIESQVEALGYECIEVRFSTEAGRRILRVTVDGESGIGLDACAVVSRALGPVLDGIAQLPPGYYLEVSSPGINRALTKPEHFGRFKGERAKLSLRQPIEGGRTVTGRLGTLCDGVLEVETPHGTKKVPLAAIERAQLQRDLGQLLKQTRH
jgi:ribosome maturation factor RimP